jgi:hypothetical protein
VPSGETSAHRVLLSASLTRREPVTLIVETHGRRRAAFVVPPLAGGDVQQALPTAASLHDSAFEEQMRRYLKATEEWAPPDRPAPAERHFIRKKRRAAHFEARTRST